MTSWWDDPDAPWRAQFAADLFPGITTENSTSDPAYDAIVADHRLAPWLHACAQGNAQNWGADANQAMARALHQQQVLVSILDLLGQQGIEPVLLKGLPLTLFCYEQPWQRPMRDLDLLIPSPEHAVQAQRLLLENGFGPVPGHQGDPSRLLAGRHQMPVLLAPDGVTYVELHLRLFHATGDEGHLRHLTRREALGRQVAILKPVAQYLHLVGHAARDHRFDNGPQILVDLAMLRKNEEIDPAVLDELATASGLVRHCRLLTAMANDAFPDAGFQHADGEDLGSLAALAWKLMTSPSGEVSAARDRLVTRSSTIGRVTERVFPTPSRLASAQGKAAGPLSLLLQYARHYRRLVTERLPRMLDSSSSDAELATLTDWLEA